MYIMNMWRFLDHRKYNFRFITFGEPLYLFYDIPDVQGHEIFFPIEARKDPTLLAQVFSETLEKEKYDVVHFNTDAWSGFMLEELAYKHNVSKIVVHSHCTGLDLEKESHRILYKKHIELQSILPENLATDYCACSARAAEWLYGDRIPKEKIKILHNAIDAKKFAFSNQVRQEVRSQKGFDGKFVIGLVANFVIAKNHIFLIDIFVDLIKTVPNAFLWLIGTGELEECIKNRSEQQGIIDRICFEGMSTEISRCIQGMDIFCMPSIREGLPIALVEAQASGLKCLVSENIPEEACLAEYAKRLPLNKAVWVKEIAKLSEGYERKNAYNDIVNAGYDISIARKELETIYS